MEVVMQQKLESYVPTPEKSPDCHICDKIMTYRPETNSFRCLDCKPLQENEDSFWLRGGTPICKTQKCQMPLIWLEGRNNWRCFNNKCSPWPKKVEPQKLEEKTIDIHPDKPQIEQMITERLKGQSSLSEDRLREIIQEELTNWHIQKPSVTRDEIAETLPPSLVVSKPETWLQKAKRLGVTTHYAEGGMRKKVDVMADMEIKEKEHLEKAVSNDGLVSPEGDTKTYEPL